MLFSLTTLQESREETRVIRKNTERQVPRPSPCSSPSPTAIPAASPHQQAATIRQPSGELGTQGRREAGGEARQARRLGKAGPGPPAAS